MKELLQLCDTDLRVVKDLCSNLKSKSSFPHGLDAQVNTIVDKVNHLGIYFAEFKKYIEQSQEVKEVNEVNKEVI